MVITQADELWTHTEAENGGGKKTCPKIISLLLFCFPPICLFPPSFIFGRPQKSPFFLSFFRTCKPEQLAFHIKYAPFNDALFSKTRKLHIPRFPPSEKKGGKWNRIYIPSRFPRPSSSSLPFSPNVKRGKRRERIHPQKWGGGNEQMHFYSRFWAQAEFISRVAFSFLLVRELRVRTWKKRVNLFRGGALLNFDIKPSKRIREGFGNEKELEWIFLECERVAASVFWCCYMLFSPPFFLPKKTLEKNQRVGFFCATCMRMWCALGNWNSILRSGSCTRVFRSFFSPRELHYFYFFLLFSIWGTVCPEISGLFTQDPKGRKENWASLSISFFFISSAHLDTAFWAHQKMFPTLFLPNHV